MFISVSQCKQYVLRVSLLSEFLYNQKKSRPSKNSCCYLRDHWNKSFGPNLSKNPQILFFVILRNVVNEHPSQTSFLEMKSKKQANRKAEGSKFLQLVLLTVKAIGLSTVSLGLRTSQAACGGLGWKVFPSVLQLVSPRADFVCVEFLTVFLKSRSAKLESLNSQFSS